MEKPSDMEPNLQVHLVRHGETASYGHDAGLTDLGLGQVQHRGRELTRLLHDGDAIAFRYSPTERAEITANMLRETVFHEAEAGGLWLVENASGPEPGYRNLQVWVNGEPREPTQARAQLDELIAAGKVAWFGWAVEAERFWRAHDETGDAMTFWLNTPLVWHESPGSVVARVLRTTLQKVAAGLHGRLVIGTHSGLLRAIVHWVSGKDPGEPENAAEVVIAAAPGSEWVTISYQNQQWSMQAPTNELDWNLGLSPLAQP